MGRIAVVVLSVLAITLGITAGADAAVLRVAATGVGADVQIKPAGLLQRCTYSSCVYRFATGSTVTLAASSSDPAGGFVGWRGACRGRRAHMHGCHGCWQDGGRTFYAGPCVHRSPDRWWRRRRGASRDALRAPVPRCTRTSRR